MLDELRKRSVIQNMAYSTSLVSVQVALLVRNFLLVSRVASSMFFPVTYIQYVSRIKTLFPFSVLCIANRCYKSVPGFKVAAAGIT